MLELNKTQQQEVNPCPLRTIYATTGAGFKGNYFPRFKTQLVLFSKKYQGFVIALEIACPENFIFRTSQTNGRPLCDRVNLARAFMAKAHWDIPTTRLLVERLKVDRRMRNLCGWVLPGKVPSESTFSRAFAEFAESNIPGQIHKAMIEEATKQSIIGHISRDSTAIHAREKPTPKCKSDQKPMKHKRGRPRKDEVRPPKAKTRLERQASGEMTLEQMLDELPKVCDRGAKINAQGFRNGWIGYKFHIDATDAGLAISCILSSASLHDSQVAIPLSDMTAQRVTYLYECMDSAYDAVQIHDHSQKHGRISIIDTNPRSNKGLKESLARERKAAASAGFIHPTDQRYGERTVVERMNGRLKDDFGVRHLRVRGHKKVQAHLMFGIVALCADQIMRLLN